MVNVPQDKPRLDFRYFRGFQKESQHELTVMCINLQCMHCTFLEKSPQRTGWWHADDMFIWAVYQSSKSARVCSVWKDVSLSGAPCVFREKGASLGVNSVTLGEADPAGLTPECLWTGQPMVTLWAGLSGVFAHEGQGIYEKDCNWDTSYFLPFHPLSCVLHQNKNRWGSHISKHNTSGEERIRAFECVFTHNPMRSSFNIKDLLKGNLTWVRPVLSVH